MPKRTYHFAAISKITLDHHEGEPNSILKSVDLRLELSGNLDRSRYIDGKGLPRKDAIKPISNALAAGIAANIKMGHEKGWWKDHEHLQYVIDQLQRHFVTNAEMDTSTMEY